MDENQLEEIEKALRDKTVFRMQGDDGKLTQAIDPALISSSINILAIEKLVKEIAQSKEVLFVRNAHTRNPQRDWMSSRPAGRRFLLLLNIDMERIEACFANNTFNSYFDVFRKWTNDFYLKDTVSYHQMLHGEDLVKWIAALNDCIEAIRYAVRSKRFSTAIKNLQRGVRKNHKSLVDYIDALFAHYSRMLVLRIDFGYKTRSLPGKDVQTSVDFLEIKTQHNLLIRHLKKVMFKGNFLGFASKFEYGLSKGYHFHSIIFLRGSKKRTDVLIAKLIGEYWNNALTKGNGLYFNCNAKKEEYLYRGIGMINCSEEDLIDNLKNRAANYLCKTDYFIKLITTGNDRAFVRGNKPGPKIERRGRPRSKGMGAQQEGSPILIAKQQ